MNSTLDDSEIAEDSSPVKVEKILESGLRKGSIIWAWLSSFPIWPGTITPAPEGDNNEGEEGLLRV